MDATDEAVFAAYHRQDRSRKTLQLMAGAVTLFAGVTLVALLGSAGSAATVVAQTPLAVPTATAEPTATPAVVAVALPAPAADVVPSVAPAPADDGPWRIAIDTSGYQAELDACLWVRMDLGAVAPIVGAHTSCGGSVILEMATGDPVVLTGTGLDGAYLVADSRDAEVGAVAATATAGLTADVILQTCYPGADGRVRLVALVLGQDS